MAILKNYIPAVHDIHTYGPVAAFPSTTGNITGFSQTCQGKDIDWTGVSIRARAFCTVVPLNLRGLMTIPFDQENINFYNTCNPCVVLVSPKHGLVCQHYRGTFPRTNETYTFMGKTGIRHTRSVVGVTLSIGSDHTLLEFNEPFPADVACYSHIADIKYIPVGAEIWNHDCNGKAYKTAFKGANVGTDGTASGMLVSPVLDGVNDGVKHDGYPGIFVGDSGSPTFVKDSRGNTVFVGLMFGGSQVNSQEFAAINAIVSASGYSLTHEKITANPADLNQDGAVDGGDMGILMAAWGNGDAFIDMNKDGNVDGRDLGLLLAAWGPTPIESNQPNLSGPTGGFTGPVTALTSR